MGNVTRAVEALYRSAWAGDAGWEGALTQVAELLGAQGATLERHDARSGPTFFAGARLPASGIDAYRAHYHAVCPRIPALWRGSRGAVITDHRLVSEREMNRSAFYQELLAPEGLRYFAGLVLRRDPRTLAFVSVQRSRREGPVLRDETAVLRRLGPHLAGALELRDQVLAADRRRADLEHTLDGMHVGALLLGQGAQVLFANAHARAALARADALECRGLTLRGATPDADRALSKLLATGEAGDALVGRAGAPALTLRLSWLPRGTGDEPFFSDAPRGAIAVLTVEEPLDAPHDPGAAWARRYGLTAAELRLARALVEGHTLREHGAQRGVSVNTVRTHLARLRAKVGVRTQAQLVAALARRAWCPS